MLEDPGKVEAMPCWGCWGNDRSRDRTLWEPSEGRRPLAGGRGRREAQRTSVWAERRSVSRAVAGPGGGNDRVVPQWDSCSPRAVRSLSLGASGQGLEDLLAMELKLGFHLE